MREETRKTIILPGLPLKREPTNLLRPVRVDFTVTEQPLPRDFFIMQHAALPPGRSTFYNSYETSTHSRNPYFADIIHYDPAVIMEQTLKYLSSLQQIDQRTTQLPVQTETELKRFNTITLVYGSDGKSNSNDYWAFKLLSTVLSNPEIPIQVKQHHFAACGQLLRPLFMGVETEVLRNIADIVVPKLKRIIFRFRASKRSNLHKAIIFHEFEHLLHRLLIYPGANLERLSSFCEFMLHQLDVELAYANSPEDKAKIASVFVAVKQVLHNIWVNTAYAELASMLIESRLNNDQNSVAINHDSVIWRLANYLAGSNEVTFEALELFIQGAFLGPSMSHQLGATMLYLQQDILGVMAFDPNMLAKRLLDIANDPNQLFNSVAEWEALYQMAYDRLRETFTGIQQAATVLMTELSKLPLGNTYQFDLKTLETVSLTDRRQLYRPSSTTKVPIGLRSIE